MRSATLLALSFAFPSICAFASELSELFPLHMRTHVEEFSEYLRAVFLGFEPLPVFSVQVGMVNNRNLNGQTVRTSLLPRQSFRLHRGRRDPPWISTGRCPDFLPFCC